MKCPYCGSKDTEVVETRDSEDLETIRRRRACLSCEKRFTTYERVENVNLVGINKDGRRERFNTEKLKSGIISLNLIPKMRRQESKLLMIFKIRKRELKMMVRMCVYL